MKPKTTLNLLKVFFSIIIQKTTLFLNTLFDKKIWSDTIGILPANSSVFHSSLIFAKSVSKTTTAKTDFGKSIKCAPPEENYYYVLQIVIL